MTNSKKLIDLLPPGYMDTKETWLVYWRLYKETGSIWSSPYLHIAALLSFILYPWLGCGYSIQRGVTCRLIFFRASWVLH